MASSRGHDSRVSCGTPVCSSGVPQYADFEFGALGARGGKKGKKHLNRNTTIPPSSLRRAPRHYDDRSGVKFSKGTQSWSRCQPLGLSIEINYKMGLRVELMSIWYGTYQCGAQQCAPETIFLLRHLLRPCAPEPTSSSHHIDVITSMIRS